MMVGAADIPDPEPEGEFDEHTLIGQRRRFTDDDIDEHTLLSERRVAAIEAAGAAEIDEHTLLSERRASIADADIDEHTMLSQRRVAQADVDEHTLLSERRVAQADVDEHTLLSERHRAPAEDDLDEHTLLSQRRAAGVTDKDIDDDTLLGQRRRHRASVDESTSVGSRRQLPDAVSAAEAGRTGGEPSIDTGALETTRLDAVMPSPARAVVPSFDAPEEVDDPAFDETARVSPRRSAGAEHPDLEVRRAAQPEQALLREPYRPRQITQPEIVRATPPPAPVLPSADSAAAHRVQATSSKRTLWLVIGGTILVVVGAVTGIAMLVATFFAA